MDKYEDFAALSRDERKGTDYQVKCRTAPTPDWLVMAPHGGGIEPGTSEIASAVARGRHSCYRFEGIKKRSNGTLHITSTRFDEPIARCQAASHSRVLAIHGEASSERIVFVGGGDESLRNRMAASLRRHGFTVKRHSNKNLAGEAPNNICNLGASGPGVQLEISAGLRRACFKSLSAVGRRTVSDEFRLLVAAIREGLCGVAV